MLSCNISSAALICTSLICIADASFVTPSTVNCSRFTTQFTCVRGGCMPWVLTVQVQNETNVYVSEVHNLAVCGDSDKHPEYFGSLMDMFGTITYPDGSSFSVSASANQVGSSSPDLGPLFGAGATKVKKPDASSCKAYNAGLCSMTLTAVGATGEIAGSTCMDYSAAHLCKGITRIAIPEAPEIIIEQKLVYSGDQSGSIRTSDSLSTGDEPIISAPRPHAGRDPAFSVGALLGEKPMHSPRDQSDSPDSPSTGDEPIPFAFSVGSLRGGGWDPAVSFTKCSSFTTSEECTKRGCMPWVLTVQVQNETDVYTSEVHNLAVCGDSDKRPEHIGRLMDISDTVTYPDGSSFSISASANRVGSSSPDLGPLLGAGATDLGYPGEVSCGYYNAGVCSMTLTAVGATGKFAGATCMDYSAAHLCKGTTRIAIPEAPEIILEQTLVYSRDQSDSIQTSDSPSNGDQPVPSYLDQSGYHHIHYTIYNNYNHHDIWNAYNHQDVYNYQDIYNSTVGALRGDEQMH